MDEEEIARRRDDKDNSDWQQTEEAIKSGTLPKPVEKVEDANDYPPKK
jgi:hypothetical protein